MSKQFDVTLDRLHDQQFEVCKMLQEQFYYLVHLSVDTFASNYKLYEHAKRLNENLRVSSYQVLKGLRNLQLLR